MDQIDRVFLRFEATRRLQRIWRLCQNRTGLPRPMLKYQGHNMPLPWVGGDNPANGYWARVDGERANKAFTRRLCIVCGRSLEGTRWLRFRLFGEVWPFKVARTPFSRKAPAPLQGHDQCALIAASFCPHLKEAETPAETLEGVPLTHDQLRQYVHDHRADDGHESLRADIEEVNK